MILNVEMRDKFKEYKIIFHERVKGEKRQKNYQTILKNEDISLKTNFNLCKIHIDLITLFFDESLQIFKESINKKVETITFDINSLKEKLNIDEEQIIRLFQEIRDIDFQIELYVNKKRILNESFMFFRSYTYHHEKLLTINFPLINTLHYEVLRLLIRNNPRKVDIN